MRMIIFITVLVMAAPATAANYSSGSCSYNDVRAAVSLVSHGDAVSVPAGNCDWGGATQDITAGIRLVGAGKNVTHITNGKIRVNVDSPNSFTMSGIHIEGPAVLLCLYGTQKQFVVKNNRFQQMNDEAITVGSPSCSPAGGDYTLGVISGNEFIYTSAHASARSPIEVVSDSTENAWARASGIGTADMVFIEDNIFDRYTYAGGRHAVWSQSGGSYVFRYNTVINFDVDVHGQCSWYGAREWEIYGNTFTCEAGVNCAYPIVVRGGTGVIYDNTIVNDGTGAYDIRIWDQRLTADCSSTVYPGDSECDNSGIYADGQYPFEYQLGRGRFNTIDPIYSWGNNYRGSSVTTANVEWNDGNNCDAVLEPDVVLHGRGAYALVEDGRDWYFQTERPGYIPFIYPHPLTQGDSADTISPAPPSNLFIRVN